MNNYEKFLLDDPHRLILRKIWEMVEDKAPKLSVNGLGVTLYGDRENRKYAHMVIDFKPSNPNSRTTRRVAVNIIDDINVTINNHVKDFNAVMRISMLDPNMFERISQGIIDHIERMDSFYG